jgi:pimeloyl-ACP methyl ester carboxylesterase
MWNSFLHRVLRVPYQLHAEVLSSPSQPQATIVLLHGIGSSLGMWKPLLKTFPKQSRIIAVDLLGFGKSPQPLWATYDTRTQARSIRSTLVALRAEKSVIFVGHSLGALVAIEYAARYTRSVRSLLLVSPPLFAPNRTSRRFDLKPEEILQRMYSLMRTNPKATEKILRLASVYKLINRGFVAKDVHIPSFLANLEAGILNQTSYNEIIQLDCPVRIVTGKFDLVVVDETLKELVSLRKNISWQSVVGAHEITGRLAVATATALGKLTASNN